MNVIYFFIAFFATLAGALAGIGGGVIMKPMFDAVSPYDALVIGFYSACGCFSMALVSTTKQVKLKTPINKKIVAIIAMSSAVGGFTGQMIFDALSLTVKNDHAIKAIQSIVLAIILVFVLVYSLNKDKIKTHHVTNPIALIFMGLGLGSIAVFLGISGGPLNVIVLSFFFSFTMKETVVYSLTLVLFAQLTKIITIILTNDISTFDLTPIPYIVCAGILGGLIGSKISVNLNNRQVEKIFIAITSLIIFICCYNAYVGISHL